MHAAKVPPVVTAAYSVLTNTTSGLTFFTPLHPYMFCGFFFSLVHFLPVEILTRLDYVTASRQGMSLVVMSIVSRCHPSFGFLKIPTLFPSLLAAE